MELRITYGPPGTGKTHEMVAIGHDRCRKQKGLFLSYTKAAAQEAASRINSPHVQASTLHSLAFRRLGLNRASVVDQRKLAEFGTAAGISFRGMDGADGEQEGDEYVNVHSYAVNRLMSDQDAYDQFGRPGTPKRFELFLSGYEQWKQTYGYLDFDDMLVRASKQRFPATPVVILDEAQDCSPLQWSVFESVCKGAKEVYVAGDDDQAIYEWGGAAPHGMATFSSQHGGKDRVLKQSHRLPVDVWKSADLFIAQMEQRVKKVWLPVMDRKGSVSRWGDFKVLQPMDSDWNVLALCRDNFRLRELQTELNEERVPYALATSNGPYENRFAKALRAWHGDHTPTDEERDALIAVCDPVTSQMANERKWRELRVLPWQRHINIPHRLREFYWELKPELLFQPLRYTLSTIHQAKGGEADVVLLDLAMTPRVEAGIDLNRDAELRVWYVGMTRARHELHLMGHNPLL